jgi:DNA adenine methylase
MLELTTPSAARGARNPLKDYPGAKFGSGVWQWLINHMPPHHSYIEPFIGSGALMQMKRPARFNLGIDLDAEVVKAWETNPQPGVTVIEGDALRILPTLPEFRKPTTLSYFDPPYLAASRRSQIKLYRCEFETGIHHVRLLQLLLDAKCMVMISGYNNPLYNDLLRHWRRDEFHTVTHRGLPAIEVVWMNFADSGRLHDYRFVGRGFRERERIKKKINRWARMLSEMPPHERNAVIERVSELRPSPTHATLLQPPSKKTTNHTND